MNRRIWLRFGVATLSMLLALTATAALGVWQYTVAHREDLSRAVLKADPVQVSTLVKSGDFVSESDYGRAIEQAGMIDCSRSFTVTGVDRAQPWVVCEFQTESGEVIAVVVGIQRTATQILPHSRGALRLVGRLQPAQSTEPTAARYVPRSSVEFLTSADLAMRWQTDVLDGYVLVADSVATQLGLRPVPADELVLPPAGIQLRNLFYAWQWWIFAAFAVFIWARYLRDEWRAASLLHPLEQEVTE